jgi:hypothetical protein
MPWKNVKKVKHIRADQSEPEQSEANKAKQDEGKQRKVKESDSKQSSTAFYLSKLCLVVYICWTSREHLP